MSLFLDDRFLSATTAAYGPKFSEDWPDFARFTPWLRLDPFEGHRVTWAPDGSASIVDLGGVYLVGEFAGVPPPGPADPFAREVAYVGRTRTRPLGARWRDLRKAVQVGVGHSGGNSLRARWIGRGSDGELASRVWVAGLPVVAVAGDAPQRARTFSLRTAWIEALLIERVEAWRAGKEWEPLVNDA